MKPRSPVVAVVLVSVTMTMSVLARRQSAAGAQRPADVVVPGAPASISLDVPANVFAAQTALRRVLDAAGIRYGLEGPAVDPNAPPLDFARTREETLQLAGRRVGDALDAIVKAAPQFRWTEIDGVIVVRFNAAGQGILDREIPSFTVADAPPRPALEAVVAALDPARPRGLGIIGFGRAGTSAMSGPAKMGHNVTLNLRNASVQTILVSIARLNGELSWTVQYDRAPASLETATITFTELGESVTAQSPVAFNTPISSAPATQRLAIGSSMPATLSSYAMRAAVKVSVEEIGVSLPGMMSPDGLVVLTPSSSISAGAPALELPDPPAQAIARIVALDSRYEWSEKNGHFRVRPKQGVPGRIDLLDQPMDGFTATNESARGVIERIGRTIGTVRPTVISPAMAARGPTPIDTAMATPISISLSGAVTARDVLDAIADATGWRWSLRPVFTPGQKSQLSLQWRGQNTAPGSIGSWSTTVDIMALEDLSPAPLPTRPPVGAIPASLDREIGRVVLSFDPGPGPFQQLALEMRLPLTVEEPPPPPPPSPLPDPRHMTRPRSPITVGPGKFSDAVYVLLEKLPGYDVDSTDGMVNVLSSSLRQSPGYFMNRPLAAFSVNNIGLFRAVGELRHALDPTFQARDWESGGGEILNRPVSLSVTNTSPRVILNRLVRLHGEVTWASTFAARDGTERTTPRVQDWIVTLTTISSQGPIVSLTANGGVPASSLLPQFTPAVRSGTRAITLDLPVTTLSLRIALGSAGRIIGVPIGFEAMVTPLSVLGERSAEYYDLTGLQSEELMNKLRELASDYDFNLTNGVYHVRPRVAPADSTAWLDQRIDRFERQFESLRDALEAVANIGRPQAGMTGRGGPTAVPSALPQSSLTARLKKTLIISLTDTTVRDILDEIARQFGSMMWSVETQTVRGTSSMSLTFSGFDGWSTGTGIR